MRSACGARKPRAIRRGSSPRSCRTRSRRGRWYDPDNSNIYYWSQLDNTRGFTADYPLNTLRAIVRRDSRARRGARQDKPCYYAAPAYIFTGEEPKPGENYRVALARMVTGDFQFARATVNYIWDQFFGRGMVDRREHFRPGTA